MTRRVLFVQASARPDGNAQAMARFAAGGLSPETAQDWRDLTAPALEPFHDLRHGGTGYGPPVGVAKGPAMATLAASDIVMVAPLYWYRLPAPAKLYLDHWSHWMRLADLGFMAAMAGKRMWLVMSHAGSSPAELAPPSWPRRAGPGNRGLSSRLSLSGHGLWGASGRCQRAGSVATRRRGGGAGAGPLHRLTGGLG